MNPLAYPVRPTHKANPVKQRVMSAKLLKLRQLQSQLNDANFHLAEVARENQVLKTLQKRQDKALSRYESTNADLPRLLHSHEEELRMLSERNKSLKKNLRELSDQLKLKTEELGKAKEQLSRLEKLNRDKHLTERETLMDRLEDLKMKLTKSEEQVTVLNRKLILESKISKQRLNTEIVKYKQSQKELVHALAEIDRLTALVEEKENTTARPRKPFGKFGNHQSMSMVHLGAHQTLDGNLTKEKVASEENFPQTPVLDVKLEPIRTKTEEIRRNCHTDLLKTPMESIKQRLSNSAEGISPKGDEAGRDFLKSRPNSSLKLEKIVKVNDGDKTKPDQSPRKDELRKRDKLELNQVDNDELVRRVSEPDSAKFDRKFNEYCSEIVSNMKSCSEVIELHRENLKSSQRDSDTLLAAFKDTEQLESKLKKSFFHLDQSDMSFVREILNEEYKFKEKGANGRKEPIVSIDNKKKLLATLRAIDNGESFDSLEDGKANQGTIMQEIYGNVSH
ncbi:lebercilin isoform X2 [Cylas formicarius]|nr:lebercilin isoform X2 [Cylas formicarius]